MHCGLFVSFVRFSEIRSQEWEARTVTARIEGLLVRRIDEEHRLVYQVQQEKIRILACRYHY